MIDPTSLDLSTLPSVALCDRATLPKVNAIYFCLGADGKVLYIGKTVNLMQRWISHHRYSQLKSMGDVRLSWLECSDISLLAEIEQALIEWFKPVLNGSKSIGKKVVVAHMDGELVRQIRVLAAMEGHSVSSYLESLAKREVERARERGVRFDLLGGSKNA